MTIIKRYAEAMKANGIELPEGYRWVDHKRAGPFITVGSCQIREPASLALCRCECVKWLFKHGSLSYHGAGHSLISDADADILNTLEERNA